MTELTERQKTLTCLLLPVLAGLMGMFLVWSSAVLPRNPAANPVQRISHTGFSCGPVSLQFILRHFGVSATLEEISQYAGTSGNGTSMLGLKRCAERFGLEVEGWSISREDLFNLPLPAIVFFNRGHFSVLRAVSSQSVSLSDPQDGEVSMSLSRFLDDWDGKTLIFFRKKGG